MNISNAEIQDAMNLLIATYPKESRIILWTEWADNSVKFTAGVGTYPDTVHGYGSSPLDAAEDLIGKAGDRDPQKLLAQKIADAKAELAKLEAQLEPPVVAMTETAPDPVSI